jgi:endonuclease/exonuclease/phosphatase family metal-dependent hydrolase
LTGSPNDEELDPRIQRFLRFMAAAAVKSLMNERAAAQPDAIARYPRRAMRFVSWNMGCGGPSKFRKTHEAAWEYLLSELRPDVALVQEALIAASACMKGRGALLMSDDKNRDNGAALFVRQGLEATRVPMKSPHAFLAAADISGPEGMFRTVSVHLYPHSGEAHQANLRLLFDALKAAMTKPPITGGRFVAGGDINAARHFDVVYEKKTYAKFFASVAKRGLHDCHFGLHGQDERTFWGKGEYQLDHFFVEESAKASVRKCDVITTAETRRLSDHSPLVLELN